MLKKFSIPLAALALSFSACNGDDPDPTPSKPKISSFSANPVTVDAGGTTTLSWAVESAKTVSIVATPGGTLLDGSTNLTGTVESAAITQQTTFELTASGDGGSARQSVTVTIKAVTGPTIVTFTANPATIDPNQTATLTWDTTDATSVDIDIVGGASELSSGPADGTHDVTPAATTTYRLTARDDDGQTTTAETTVTVNVQGTPTITSFTANPMTITEGDSTTLSWNVSDADTIVITNSGGTEIYNGTDATGTVQDAPTAPSETYTLTASNTIGDETANVTVTVNAVVMPEITSFAANPSTVDLGVSSDLSWVVANATSIEISDGTSTIHTDTAGTGTFSVTPLVDTTYTLTAINANGNDTAQATVTVTPGAPVIQLFEAAPNPVGINGNTTLSWQTLAGDSLRVLRGMTELYTTTTDVDSGSHVVAQTVTSTTYVLEVTNTVGNNTFSVVVFAHAMPTINSLTVMPTAIPTGTATTATVTWDVEDVATLTLTANGTPVTGFPGVSTTTAAVDSTGSVAVQVSQTTTFELTATSAAGTVTAQVIVATTVGEIEPNNTSSTALALPGDGSGATGSINPGDDEDWYSIVVPEGGSVYAETTDGRGGCPFDTQLTLTSTDGATTLVFDDDGGISLCSLIDPMNAADSAATNLPAGTYFIKVGSYGSNTGDYVLTVLVSAPGCGNGLLEGTEVCDDGNTANGDGCSDQCQVEPAGTVNGPMAPGTGVTFNDAIDVAGRMDFYEVVMATTGYIKAELFSPTAPDCGDDFVLRLYDSTFTELGSDSAYDPSCAMIDPAVDVFASVAQGSYWVSVEEIGNNSTVPAYELTISPFGVGCGNGILETPEVCDDGNVVPGDGCDQTCQFEGTLEDESGGNDAFDGLGVHTATQDTLFSGALNPATDVDYYAVTVPEGYHLEAFVTVNSFDHCADGGPRGEITLFDTDGTTQLATDNSNGPDGNCGRLHPDTTNVVFEMTAGTYYLRVQEVGQDEMIDPYFLHLRVIAPGCGNAVFEISLGETCDDGNVTPGDGCDATCQIEPDGVVTGPGATAQGVSAVFADSIVPLDDIDIFRLEVQANSFVRVETGVPVLGDCTVQGSGETTNFGLRIFDPVAGTELGNVQTSNCPGINPETHAWAATSTGTYFLTVEEWNRNNEISAYEVRIYIIPQNICGNAVREGTEQCDDGNNIGGDGCSDICAIEPLGVVVGPPGTGTFTDAIVPSTNVDYYEITMNADGYIRAETWAPMAPDCTGVDTEIRLLDATYNEIMSDDLDGVDSCSLIDPTVDALAAVTGDPAGTVYYIAVEEDDQNAEIAGYQIQIDAIAIGCGNGILEGSEMCDDGNTANNDGCDSGCNWEVAGVINAPGGTVSITLPAPDDYRIVQVNVTAGQSVTATAADVGGASCDNVDTHINFADATFAVLGTKAAGGPSGTAGDCASIWFPADTFATNLAAGAYYIAVVNTAGGGAVEVTASMIDPICGNGVVETNAPTAEQCDDGNNAPGDGCDAACQVEGVDYVEVEANNDATTATDIGTIGTTTVTVYGSISPALDEDWYSFTIAAEGWVNIETLTDRNAAAGDRCPAPVDSYIELIDSDGTTVLDDDEDGADRFCSMISLYRLTPGTYYFRFLSSPTYAPNATIPGYFAWIYANPVPSEAPLITSTPASLAVVGVQYDYQVVATGVPVPTLAAPTFPTWLTFDPSTGLLSGTPQVSDTGMHNVVITASNGIPPAANQPFTIDVQNQGSPPVLSEDFEAGAVSWSHSALVGTDDWAVGVPNFVDGPAAAAVGSQCAATNLTDDYSSSAHHYMQTPAIDLTGVGDPAVRFTHWFDFESTYNCYDGGNLKISFDGGTSFVLVPGTDLTHPYTGSIYATSNAMYQEEAWCGPSTAWTTVTANLVNVLMGQPVNNVVIRWEFGSDSSVGYPGWYLDEVYVGQLTGLPN